MNRPLVAYTDVAELDPGPGVALLEQAGFDVVVLDTADPEKIVAGAHGAQALLVGYSPITAEVIAALPDLRIIATQSAGVDTVDTEACAARGIRVANVPGAATEEVASHALAMTLALLRGLPMLDRDVRSGLWDPTGERLHRPSEVTVGVIGLGRIGSRFAELAAPIVGRVVGHDPVLDAHPAVGVIGLDEVLAQSDVVSLHLPLTDRTRHLIGADRLARMPAGSFLVNVSRGALVDPDALLHALDTGHLAAAALDVLPTEPPDADDPLVTHPRTLVTPHAGYLSAASARDYVTTQARNVAEFLGTEP